MFSEGGWEPEGAPPSDPSSPWIKRDLGRSGTSSLDWDRHDPGGRVVKVLLPKLNLTGYKSLEGRGVNLLPE